MRFCLNFFKKLNNRPQNITLVATQGLVCFLIFFFFSTVSAATAPPNFDPGALLEQLNKQPLTQPARPPLPAETQTRELLTGFEFRELPGHLVPIATAFLQPYIGKEVKINSLLMALYAHLQSRDPHDNYIFIAKKIATGYVFIAQKVIFDGVTIEANTTRSNDIFLANIMGYKLIPHAPLDYFQIERNATIVSEIPGIISQFNMKPGAQPGSSNVHLSTDQGSVYVGSIVEDNSTTHTLGEWTTRADVATYNQLGLGDIVRLTGQLTQKSNSAGLDASAVVHPSGLRAGFNLSTFHYGYKSDTDTVSYGTELHSTAHYTGVSNSLGLNLLYPLVRTDEMRQNLTLDLNYNTSVSDVSINQQTTVFGTSSSLVSESDAFYHLSELLIKKAAVGTNGALALPFSRATINYQLAVTVGNASQDLTSVALQDSNGERTLGGFIKGNLNAQYSQAVAINETTYEGVLMGELQVTHRNLAGPEKAYLGGIYKMQAWEPQAIGGSQMAYFRGQLARSFISAPGVVLGVFAELATIQVSHRNYLASVGNQTIPVDTSWQTLSDMGAVFNYTLSPNISLSTTIAKKLGRDITVNGATQDSGDGVRGWLTARITF